MSPTKILALAAVFPLAVVACTGNMNVNPLGSGGSAGADSGADAADASGGGGETSVPPAQTAERVRTVEQRNPYGHTDIDNLMVDGDFEFTGAQGQYGWYAIAQGQQANLVRETGGLCHSGVACGVMMKGTDFLGQAAAPANENIDISLWIKPPPKSDCHVVNATLIECSNSLPIVLSTLTPVQSKPDKTGWCQLTGSHSPMTAQPCLYLKTSEDNVLVDDASLVGVQGSSSSAHALAATVPSPELYARMKGALEWVHGHMLLGRAPTGRP